MMETGRAFVFGDRIDTDVLAPGGLLKLEPDALAAHCLSAIAPDFAKTVRPGDFVVAGESFGIGSSREQAVVSLKRLGVRAVIARGFAGIFYRNAFNLGLPALIMDPPAQIEAGDRLSLDPAMRAVINHDKATRLALARTPDHLLALIAAGGLVNHLRTTMPARREANE